MTAAKVHFPSEGCLVEFMQGNSPVPAIVLEARNDRLRLYSIAKRELTLSPSRLLPWSGPFLGAGLSRQRMDEALEAHRALRDAAAAGISALELWELAQGEISRASIEWLAGLLWTEADIDREAALGHALLSAKAYFRFSPPDFEVFDRATVEKRLAEAESNRLREVAAAAGARFFHKLWEARNRKRGEAPPEPPEEFAADGLGDRLKAMLLARAVEPEQSDEAALWKALVKGLPDLPHLALVLAESWGLVPEHYNFLLDRIGYGRGEDWARDFAGECGALARAAELFAGCLEPDDTPYVSVDAADAADRDDALHVELKDGVFLLRAALACPAAVWPFGGPLDKAVQKRASSLYLPEGNEHMLPSSIGRALFSLDEGLPRPALVFALRLSEQGELLQAAPELRLVRVAANLDPAGCEPALADGGQEANAAPPAAKAALHTLMLRKALALARILRRARLAAGAVITERRDPELSLTEDEDGVYVDIVPGPHAPLTHMLVEEMMVLCNGTAAAWGREHAVPLFYRTQNVALPREFAGVWSEPHDLARVIRSLPPATLECEARRHAGLALEAYAMVTSPLRRYTDLFNQGQIIRFLLQEEYKRGTGGTARAGGVNSAEGVEKIEKTEETGDPAPSADRPGLLRAQDVLLPGPPLSREETLALLPLISARAEAAGQVQRLRPRYWKLLFFCRHGDKKWWDAVVAEENENFAVAALPWAQLMVRGRRRQFDEKIYPGMRIKVRLGKINPLTGEIQLLESTEA
ncbi:MAG: RNB domain-containing ribonuclease [Desulfovibrio sp.]|jgi:exoribonuclease-2|nr:RNB domain-containing ribonuclease [Desulfovibrio sp.]